MLKRLASIAIFVFVLLGCYRAVFKNAKDSRPHLWSIGIVSGKTPLALEENKNFPNPRFTAKDITGFNATFVADPFLVEDGNNWLLFFEAMNSDTGRGEIALARSEDGFNWKYDQSVLREPFHLSYPFVFKEGDDHYMIPETRAAQEVRLYRADPFPTKWKLEKVLFKGNYSDSSIVAYEGKWWIFANRNPYTLDLWYANDLMGPWIKHPASPIYEGDNSCARPGGRPIVLGGKILRFAQDNRGGYGKHLRGFLVEQLDEQHFAEHPVEPDPIWAPRGINWSFNGAHHMAPVLTKEGTWIASIDGNGIPQSEPPEDPSK